jgi:hypothetical protein
MLRKAKRAREKRLGKENDATLASTSMFALILSDKGFGEKEVEKFEVTRVPMYWARPGFQWKKS